MIIPKSKNEVYGKQFERMIDDYINNREFVNYYSSKIPEKDIAVMKEHVKDFVDQYSTQPLTSFWIGNKTISGDGDLVINDEIIEVKYVNSGLGTWINASINHIYDYVKIKNHIEYMEEVGLLNSFLPYANSTPAWKIRNNTPNPLNAEQAKKFCSNEDYEQKDEAFRKNMIKDIVDYFNNNPIQAEKFCADCVSKKLVNKTSPKKLCVFNHENKKLYVYDKNSLNSLIASGHKIRQTSKGINFGNGIHIQLSWKNRCGCNLAIYVFINPGDEKED